MENMDLTIYLEKENSTQKIKFTGRTVKELLKQLKINPEIVIVARNNEVLSEEESLKNKDSLKIFSVVSGG
jgi:thiamine biosynthesis protein ThiS